MRLWENGVEKKGLGVYLDHVYLQQEKVDDQLYANRLRSILPPKNLGVKCAKVSTRVK